jgi:hypothetical protein
MGHVFSTPNTTHEGQPPQPQEWDPGRALLQLKEEQDSNLDSNDILRTEERLRKNGPIAAEALIHLAQYSTNERIRLEAAKHLLDRVLGKPQEGGLNPTKTVNPLEALLSQITSTTSSDPTPGHGYDA